MNGDAGSHATDTTRQAAVVAVKVERAEVGELDAVAVIVFEFQMSYSFFEGGRNALQKIVEHVRGTFAAGHEPARDRLLGGGRESSAEEYHGKQQGVLGEVGHGFVSSTFCECVCTWCVYWFFNTVSILIFLAKLGKP